MRHGWSLDHRDWIRLDKLASGRRWRRVPFAGLHAESIPEASGIYGLCSSGLRSAPGMLGELYAPVYVGQARNLRNRFLQHARNPSLEVGRAMRCFRILEFWYTRV